MAMTDRLERLTLLVGILLLVIAATALDWRLGAVVAGLALILSTIDFRGARR